MTPCPSEDKQMVHNLVHKEAVVRYDDDASGEVLRVFLQHLKRLDVKVVGRLVEYEEVGIAHQHRTQIELASLAAGKLIHVVVLLFGREEEVLQELCGCDVLASTIIYIVGDVRDDVDDALLVVKLHAFLREIAEAYGVADVERTAVRRHLSEEHLDER